MGYDLHITRAPNWFDSPQQPISRQEWEAYARRHCHLSEDGTVTWAHIGGQPVFTYAARHDTDVSLAWYESRIVVSGRLDESAVRQIAQMAEDLGAALIGDEGERYGWNSPATDCPQTASRASGRRPRTAAFGLWVRLRTPRR